MAVDGTTIGNKYGQSQKDFAKASTDTVSDVVVAWCNEGVEIMRKVIYKKSRTKGGSTLAGAIQPAKPSVVNGNVVVTVSTDAKYADYVDKGVIGVRGNKGAVANSKGHEYKFKTMGVNPDMVKSFVGYIAASGLKSFKNNATGKRTRLIRKDKAKQTDLIKQAATAMAVATKIGGIKPMNFIAPAITKERFAKLNSDIKKGFGVVIKFNIINDLKETK